MRKVEPYNPLDIKHLAENIAGALLNQEPESLPPEPFIGAGIYSIYYSGDFKAYQPIALANRERLDVPIYVGRAESKGGRRGGDWNAPAGAVLFSRLQKHSVSIEQAGNLDMADFRCRHLVLNDLWVRIAERMLISMHQPLWNVVVDGFGNNDPGSRRTQQRRSPWDTLHPGRPWADGLAEGNVALSRIQMEIDEHFKAG